MGEPIDRSKRVFSDQTRDFNVAFPELEDATVEYLEGRGDSLKEKAKKGEYEFSFSLREWRGGLFRCSSSLCENGGYEIDHAVREMIDSGKKVIEDSIKCIGYEKMPKKLQRMGHIRKDCYNHFYCRITLKYK